MSSHTLDLFDPATSPANGSARLSLVPPSPGGGKRLASRELWLCLWLPRLALEAVAREEAGASRPCCAIDGEGARQSVAAVNAAAAHQGVMPGMGLNAALALCPGLELHARQPAAEAALLARLGQWATRFTPQVSLEPPQAVLAELRGSLKLFGGPGSLRCRALQELGGFGLQAVAALAPTPRAASWLARAGREEIVESLDELPTLAARLPLSCLDWPAPVLRTLSALGAQTVADIVRLPRDGFARRFGPRLLDELDEGFGRRPQPRQRAVVPERFDDGLELPAESGSLKLLEIALERLLGRLETFLRLRAAGVGGLVVELRHRDLPATRFRLGLARPGGDVRHLLALLHERLARTPLPAPVVALRLRSTVVVPLELRPGVLPGGREREADPEAAARLLERLRARLGREAVFSVGLVPEHRPELAWRVVEPMLPDVAAREKKGDIPHFRQAIHGIRDQCPETATVPARPLWMLSTPQPLGMREGLPQHEGRPLEIASGPERIESGWWDGGDVRRDYYVAAGREGVRLWVYRERSRDGGWWLHGVFG